MKWLPETRNGGWGWVTRALLQFWAGCVVNPEEGKWGTILGAQRVGMGVGGKLHIWTTLPRCIDRNPHFSDSFHKGWKKSSQEGSRMKKIGRARHRWQVDGIYGKCVLSWWSISQVPLLLIYIILCSWWYQTESIICPSKWDKTATVQNFAWYCAHIVI